MRADWKEIRKTGLWAFLLAVPVMLWKDIGIGKRISWILIIVTAFWTIEKGVDFAYSHIIDRQEIRKNVDQVIGNIKAAQARARSVASFIDRADSLIQERFTTELGSRLEQANKRIEGLNQKLDLIDRSVVVLTEIEQKATKDKVIELRERILVAKSDVNLARNRKDFEAAFGNLSLLTPDEQSRFRNDLKEMGFYFEKEKKSLNLVRSGRVFATSMDVAVPSFQFISSDGVYINRFQDEE